MERALKRVWTRTQTPDGTVYTAPGGLEVRKVTWTPPGFKKRKSWGWAGFVNGERTGPAYPRALDAQWAAEGYAWQAAQMD